jgi:hypothetical protein
MARAKTKAVHVDESVWIRLLDHAADCERDPVAMLTELVRDYLDGTGPWAEVSTHLLRIKALEQALRDASGFAGSLSKSLLAAAEAPAEKVVRVDASGLVMEAKVRT